MKPLIATVALAWLGASTLACAVWAVVAPRLLHDEDEHGTNCLCPGCVTWPDDDLMDLAEAAGVAVPVPLVRELAWTPVIREMPINESATWLATARDIDDLPVIGGGR